MNLIYEDFVRVSSEDGARVVEVRLGKSKGEADGDARLVTLRCYLGADYPSGAEMPAVEIRGVNWSRRDQGAIYDGTA